jgi:hypothetical protein
VKIPWYAQLLLCGWIILRKNQPNHPFITRDRTEVRMEREINLVIERIHNMERGNTYVTSNSFCAMGKCSRHSELIDFISFFFFFFFFSLFISFYVYFLSSFVSLISLRIPLFLYLLWNTEGSLRVHEGPPLNSVVTQMNPDQNRDIHFSIIPSTSRSPK